jgi:hypothetical protein
MHVVVAVTSCVLLPAVPAMADVIYDEVGGLTPGDRYGGHVEPQGGGDNIPLADGIVGADRKYVYVKPGVAIEKIVVKKLPPLPPPEPVKKAELGTSNGSDLWGYLQVGNRWALFAKPGDEFAVWTGISADQYNLSLPLNVGDTFFFSLGHNPAIPGVGVWHQDNTPFTGLAYVFGHDTVIVPEPSSVLLLAAGGIATLVRRRV